ncbi:MAG: MarR family transcriptional regulator [Pseudomonadota bacterium]
MADVEIARLIDRLMRRIHSKLNAASSTFDHHQLGPAGGMLLLSVAEHAPLQAQQLAELLARDKAQIARAVQSLERKGLVTREDNPDDGRAKLLRLTQEGQRTVDVLEQAVAEALQDILSPLSSANHRQLKDLLRKL